MPSTKKSSAKKPTKKTKAKKEVNSRSAAGKKAAEKPAGKAAGKPSGKQPAKKQPARKRSAKPPAKRAFIQLAADPTIDNLNKIEHIVVLMLENRSFDQMLGYLRLEQGRDDIDGLSADLSNTHEGKVFSPRHATSTLLTDEQDPCHSGACVIEQLSNNNGGFVSNYAQTNALDPDPGTIMSYYNAGDLPMYDHLAQEFCVCDRWFSPVGGATWPNRLYAVGGRSNGSKENKSVPLYNVASFVQHLDAAKVSWRWYAHERVLFTKVTTLRLIDDKYRTKGNHAFFKNDFFKDAKAGKLPAVSWIDPNFIDFGGTFEANDDHAPADVLAAQELVLKIYHALTSSPVWDKTMLVVTYDEHGGFYDHVPPPEAQDDDPNFKTYGVRVPALVISPFVARRSASHTVYDHTSIIKSILLRFCRKADGSIPDMTKRVTAANHLGDILTESTPRPAPPTSSYQHAIDQIAEWHKKKFDDALKLAVAAPAIPKLTEFQKGFLEAAKRLNKLEKNSSRP
jgi:phospholipase C